MICGIENFMTGIYNFTTGGTSTAKEPHTNSLSISVYVSATPAYESDPSLILSMTRVKHPGQYVWVRRQSAGFTPCVFRYKR